MWWCLPNQNLGFQSSATRIKAHLNAGLFCFCLFDNSKPGKVNLKKPSIQWSNFRRIKMLVLGIENAFPHHSSPLRSQFWQEFFMFCAMTLITRANVTVLKGSVHVDAQILLHLFWKRFNLSAIPKNIYPSGDKTRHTYIHNDYKKSMQFPFSAKATTWF